MDFATECWNEINFMKNKHKIILDELTRRAEFEIQLSLEKYQIQWKRDFLNECKKGITRMPIRIPLNKMITINGDYVDVLQGIYRIHDNRYGPITLDGAPKFIDVFEKTLPPGFRIVNNQIIELVKIELPTSNSNA